MINQNILDDLDQLEQEMEQENNAEFTPNPHNEQDQVKQQGNPVVLGSQKYSRLLTVNSQKFLAHMQYINELIDDQIVSNKRQQDYDRDQTVENINKCNKYALEINKQITAIAKHIKSIYGKKVPELESIVNNDGNYCKAIIEIQTKNNQIDPRIEDEEQAKPQSFAYLSPHQRISLTILISSYREPLSREDQEEVLSASRTVVELQNYHDTLMIFLQSRMQIIAPNLCQLLGSVTASKLIATAGGIDKLAAMPACNIQVMGGSRSAQVGLSQLERNHTGVFGQMEAVKDAPKKFQMQLVRMLATNTAKCARADYLGSNSQMGIKLREQMFERFQKIQQEGGLTRQERPMDIPDMQPKKKRGGKRHRKQKELYEMSSMRKQQNRVQFGEAQEEIDEGVGLGMLKSGTGKIRVQIKKQKLKVNKKMQQRLNKKSGLESTLNLGAHQGIELINPALRQAGQQLGSESYFSKQSGFRTVLNNKLGK